MTPDNPILTVDHLTVIYEQQVAIHDLHFDVPAGARVAVIGPNGAGKSTLMKAIMGLLPLQSGTISCYAPLGYVPQYEDVNWDFPVTVRDVVMMGRTRHIGWLRWPNHAHWAAVEQALERVGMAAFSNRQVGELSGGQRRRVFIARALAQQAEVLVLDEPFSGVDARAQSEIMHVLDDLHAAGMSILLSTHDLDLAFQRFDRVMALHHHMVAYGPPAEVYNRDTLAQLYGSRLATLQDGQQVNIFVDDHRCC
jgi:ABC-type Mn2+/Zn2+ transport system ATPase subunit